MTKNLLLVAESFPPVGNIAAQRFPPMLPVLEAHGWQTWVLTKDGSGPLPVPLPEARIIRIGRHHQEGLGVRADSHFARGSRIRMAARAAYKATRLTLRSADGSLLTWRRPVLKALPTIRARLPPRIDLVLGTYAPPAALWLARRLAAVYRVPWIADFRDLAALRPDGRPWYARWLDRRIEARLLSGAAALTTCGECWAAILERRYGLKTHVIYNGWDPGRPPPSDGAGMAPAGGRPYLYYAGRLYERQLEAVSRLLRAIEATPFELVVRSLGPREREDEVLRCAEQVGVRRRVHLLPPAPPDAVTAEAQAAAANLVLETVGAEDEWTRGHLSGKFLQLLPLRPPVVFVARADSEAGGILERTGKGALCTSVEDIRRQLRRVLADDIGPVNPAAVLEFSKARQAEKLLGAIEEAAHARSGSRRLRAGAGDPPPPPRTGPEASSTGRAPEEAGRAAGAAPAGIVRPPSQRV